ncbi:MAG: hypothetical protein ACI9DK_001121 [Vicingaceae bacterium]|jgi:hypothetical protein
MLNTGDRFVEAHLSYPNDSHSVYIDSRSNELVNGISKVVQYNS